MSFSVDSLLGKKMAKLAASMTPVESNNTSSAAVSKASSVMLNSSDPGLNDGIVANRHLNSASSVHQPYEKQTGKNCDVNKPDITVNLSSQSYSAKSSTNKVGSKQAEGSAEITDHANVPLKSSANAANIIQSNASHPSENSNANHAKPWPFSKALSSQPHSSPVISRGSSDVDLCPADSVDDSRPADNSWDGSERESSSQSPLSYIIQLNEDSECSLPSEAGTSARHPVGFDRILIRRASHDGDSVDDSVELDIPIYEQTDSVDLSMDLDAESKISDSAEVQGSSGRKVVKSVRRKSSKAASVAKQVKDGTEQTDGDGDEQKKTSSSAKSRVRKKVSLAPESITSVKEVDGKKRVFEYQWPADDRSADWYLLQEHISEFLGVVSFKRKYPDIFRRTVDISEREYLQEQGVVTEMQCDLGLTALLAEEVYDLMKTDYAEKFKEYAKVSHKKEKPKPVDHHRTEMPTEKSKLETLLKKSIKSAAEFNASLMKELRSERRAYFDLQTYEVHYPQSAMRVVPKKASEVGLYPVAVLPGQYQEYYKRYTPAELKYFPLNTALYSPHKALQSVYVEPSNEPTAVPEEHHEEKNESAEPQKEEEPPKPKVVSQPESEPVPNVSVETIASVDETQKSTVREESSDEPREPPKKVRRVASRKKVTERIEAVACSVCDQVDRNKLGAKEELVKCSVCFNSGHPTCLDLTSEMIPIIKTYEWQCMECKTCVKCMKPHDEDKMMFCDHCDRGYHTFCVGVPEIPEGRWECPSCTLAATSPSPPKAKRGRPFKCPKPPAAPAVPDESDVSLPPTPSVPDVTAPDAEADPAVDSAMDTAT